MKQTPPERRGLSLFRGNFGDPYTQGALKPSAPSSSRCKTKTHRKGSTENLSIQAGFPRFLLTTQRTAYASFLRIVPPHCGHVTMPLPPQ